LVFDGLYIFKEGLAEELAKKKKELERSALLKHPDYLKLEQIIKGTNSIPTQVDVLFSILSV
jgi:hypothetical protein